MRFTGLIYIAYWHDIIPQVPSVGIPSALCRRRESKSQTLYIGIKHKVRIECLAFCSVVPIVQSHIFQLFIVQQYRRGLILRRIRIINCLYPGSIHSDASLERFYSFGSELKLHSFFTHLHYITLCGIHIQIIFICISQLRKFWRVCQSRTIDTCRII